MCRNLNYKMQALNPTPKPMVQLNTPSKIIQEYVEQFEKINGRVSEKSNVNKENIHEPTTVQSLQKRCKNMEFILRQLDSNLRVMNTVFIPIITNAYVNTHVSTQGKNNTHVSAQGNSNHSNHSNRNVQCSHTTFLAKEKAGLLSTTAAGSGIHAANMIKRRESLTRMR